MEEARGAAAACQPERLRATLLGGGRKEETQETKAEMSDRDRIWPRALLLLQLSIMEATLERQPRLPEAGKKQQCRFSSSEAERQTSTFVQHSQMHLSFLAGP